eukprot:tig00020563_g11315.t1
MGAARTRALASQQQKRRSGPAARSSSGARARALRLAPEATARSSSSPIERDPSPGRAVQHGALKLASRSEDLRDARARTLRYGAPAGARGCS